MPSVLCEEISKTSKNTGNNIVSNLLFIYTKHLNYASNPQRNRQAYASQSRDNS